MQIFGLKILTAGCLNSSTKFTFGLGKSARFARRSKQSGKRRSCRSSNSSFPPSYPEKSRSIKASETEEKEKLAELQVKIQFLEQRQRAENLAGALKVQEEMAGIKARMEVYKIRNESQLKKVRSHHQ